METGSETSTGFENEDKIVRVGGGGGKDGCWMRLNGAKMRKGEEDMLARSPIPDPRGPNLDLGYIAWKCGNSGPAQTAVVVGVAESADEAVEDVEPNGDVNIDSGIHHRDVDHDRRNESYECDDVLENEEFV